MDELSLPTWFIVIYSVLWITVLVPELGRIVAALFTRQRVFELFFGLQKPFRTISLGHVNLHMSGLPIAGFTEAYPVRGRNLRWRLLVFFLAGPLTLAVLCVGASLLRELPWSVNGTGNIIKAGLRYLAIASPLILVASAVSH